MIGNRLKQIRLQKKLSQKALADILSTSSGYISEVEQGKTMPGGNFLSSLYRVLSISIDWLLSGEGEPFLDDRRGDKKEHNAAEPASKGLDSELLRRIIAAIEKELDERDLVLDPDKKAEAISLLYEMYSGTKKEVTDKTVGKYLRLVA